MVIFVKRLEKLELDENFQVAIKFDKDLMSVHGKSKGDQDKVTISRKQ